ncbi:TPA: hypothetical protein OUB66_001896 [Corynebacterium aurimucosum]|nr:hypothetical protein [Corynebacterium aurimucosum]
MTTTTSALRIEPAPGLKRKRLAHAIATTLNEDVSYLGVPSCAYQGGQVRIDPHWNALLPPKRDDLSDVVTAAAADLGCTITAIGADVSEAAVDTVTDEPGLVISLPLPGERPRVEANLRALLASKGSLIARVLDIPATPLTVTDSEVSFPWFTQLPEPEVIEAATALIAAMVTYAHAAKRISARPAPGGNDKYTMRCFLLRLGFIGPTHKPIRKTFLKYLDGNSAWCNPS